MHINYFIHSCCLVTSNKHTHTVWCWRMRTIHSSTHSWTSSHVGTQWVASFQPLTHTASIGKGLGRLTTLRVPSLLSLPLVWELEMKLQGVVVVVSCSSCLLLSLKHAHCCRIVAPSLLVCSLWQVDDVALESLVSRCQSIRHLNLSWTGGGGQITEQALCRWRETMLASGSILALFLGLPHLQCSIGLQYAKTGEGKSKYTCIYDNS